MKPTPRGSQRRGVTLTEVLVSLGIMSIGVISLATLFPLSVLRTVQATQLTHSTLLRYNVEGLLEAFPLLIHDPDPDQNLNTAEHVNEFFVIDPIGFCEFNTTAPGIRDSFGHDNAGLGITATPKSRYGSFLFQTAPNFDNAVDFASLPDSFVDYFDEVPAPAAPPLSSVTLASAADVGELTAGDRLVLFDSSGRRSEIRTVTSVASAPQIDFSPAINFTPERVIGQARDARYTWLVTCRRSTGLTATTVSVNVAVFFNRKLSIAEEQLFPVANGGGKQVQITVVPGVTEPNVKAGGYLLDAENLLWYRIEQVGSTVGNTLNLTLAEPLKSPTSTAMFPERLVDVYPIGSFTAP